MTFCALDRPGYRATVWFIALSFSWAPAAAGAQEPVLTARGVAKDCSRAQVEAVLSLLQNNGTTLTEWIGREKTRSRGAQGTSDFNTETRVQLGAFFDSSFFSARSNEAGDCVVDVTLTKDQLANAQQPWLRLLESRTNQAMTLEALRSMRNEIESLRGAVESGLGMPTTRPSLSRKRLPGWPAVVGIVGAAVVGGAAYLEDRELRLRAAEGRILLNEAYQMLERRNQLTRVAVGTGAASVVYLIVRQIVGAKQDLAATRNWSVVMDNQQLRMSWLFNR